MLRYLLNSALILFLLSGQSLDAQQLFTRSEAPVNSVLWKVEGNGLTEASYLFATMHLLCAKDYSIPKKVQTALEDVDSLCLEMNITEPNEMTYVQQQSLANPKLSETLTDEQIAKLKELLPKKTGMTFEQLEIFTLSTISSIATMKLIGCDAPVSVEAELLALTEKSAKPVIALETAKEQMEILSSIITADELIESLEQSEIHKKALDRGVDYYLKEEISAASTELMSTSDMSFEDLETLLYKRNRTWVKSMAKQMKSNSVLYAVGASHLVENQGLIALLKKAGYTLTPITD